MQMELGAIIEKIKKEGISEAESKAADIIKQAEKKAKDIVKKAEADAADTARKAQADADNTKRTGEEAVRQASRDVLLGLKESITALFDGAMKKIAAQGLAPENIKDIIISAVQRFREDEKADVELLLSDKDKDAIEQSIRAVLKEDIEKGGITIKASPQVEHGFRIGKKGEHFYYDFTDAAIAEAFQQYLNPRIAEILKKGTENKNI